jgi:hypothetical protein
LRPGTALEVGLAHPLLEFVDEDPVGRQHAGEFVVEEFVEALAADSRIAEDVADGGRLVAFGGGHLDHGRQQPLALRALDQLARQAVAPARKPPATQVLWAIAHRKRHGW